MNLKGLKINVIQKCLSNSKFSQQDLYNKMPLNRITNT